MQEYMTPSRIANAILQDNSYEGYYILLEGEKDIKLYKKFIDSSVKIKITFGKSKQRDVYEELTSRNFFKKVAIRDADFIRTLGNTKFDSKYDKDIFLTDYHDSEVMMINSEALNSFFSTIHTGDKINIFETKYGNIKNIINKLAITLAHLKLVNKRYKLGLHFKPKDISSPKIKYRKFICEKDFIFLGKDELVDTVIEYSKNKSDNIFNKKDILSKLDIVEKEENDILELVNGHNLCEILYILLNKGVKIKNSFISDADSIESALCMSYDSSYFKITNLYKNIEKWEKNNNIKLLKI